jgi:GT2 family glycosyltransferase
VYPPDEGDSGFLSRWRETVGHLRTHGHIVRVVVTDERTRPLDMGGQQDVHRELRAYRNGERDTRASLLAYLRIERHNGRTLERHLRDFEPDVVSWWSMGGLSVGLLERVRRRGIPAVAVVQDDWLDYGRRVDRWHEWGRRHRQLARLLERATGVPAHVRFADAARYVFVSRTIWDRARATGVALPDVAILDSHRTTPGFGEVVRTELETTAARSRGPEQLSRPSSVDAGAGAPRLSVVIPTYRRHAALARSLDALERQTVAANDFEVIVVDDPEEDDAEAVAEAVAAERRPFAARHLHRHARGVSAARNVGWRAARAPIVMFLGDDILGDRDLLEQHLRWQACHPDERVGVLGHVRWARELELTPFMRWLEHGTQFDYHTIPGSEASWGHFYTSNVSVKRALLERAGGFDEQHFPFLYEDLDLGYRLSDLGFRLLYNRRARAQHLHQTDLAEWRRRMAATALAERQWVALHPQLRPYFYEHFSAAAAHPVARGRTGRYLLRWVPTWMPWLGRRVWTNATIYYRQQLGPAFLQAWREAEAR